MITLTDVIMRAKTLGRDVSVSLHLNTVEIIIEDFNGFDNNGEVIFRELDDAYAIGSFRIWLRDNTRTFGFSRLYTTYYFNGFDVEIGFASDLAYEEEYYYNEDIE